MTNELKTDDLIYMINKRHNEVVDEEFNSTYACKKPNNLRNEPKYNNMKPKNIKVRKNGVNILVKILISGAVAILVGTGIYAILPKTPEIDTNQQSEFSLVTEDDIQTIGLEQCDFSNIHVVLRAAKKDTVGVVNVCHDEFEMMGVSNERISKDDDIVEIVNNAKNTHPGKEIVVINVENGVERTSDYETILMTDGDNNKINTADTLVACMNTSFKEYDQKPDVRSGKFSSSLGRRTETSIEKALREAGLEAGVTQFTVDLTDKIKYYEIDRNDSATAIVEGMMRWAALPAKERHQEVYYMVEYGDTLGEIAEEYNTSVNVLKAKSGLGETSVLGAGWTLNVKDGPTTASTLYKVDNPTVTSNINDIETVTYSHVVSPGDTLSEIAETYNVPLSSLKTKSGKADQIQEGEVIYFLKNNYYLTNQKEDLTPGFKRTY